MRLRRLLFKLFAVAVALFLYYGFYMRLRRVANKNAVPESQNHNNDREFRSDTVHWE
jgi:hypothetical protein